MKSTIKGLVVGCGVMVLLLLSAHLAQATLEGEGVWIFDDVTGSSVPDSSGNGNTLTLIDNATTSSDTPFAYAGNLSLSLDGAGDIATLANMTDFSTDATVQGWIKPTAIGAENWLWRVGRTVSGGSAYHAARIVGGGNLQAFYGNQSGAAVTGATIPLNTWTHVAVTYEDGVGIQIYLDGSPDGSAGWVLSNTIGNPTEVILGAENTGGSNAFAGLMDEVVVHAGLRTQGQILADAQNSIVPEPMSAVMLGLGGLMLMLVRWRHHAA